MLSKRRPHRPCCLGRSLPPGAVPRPPMPDRGASAGRALRGRQRTRARRRRRQDRRGRAWPGRCARGPGQRRGVRAQMVAPALNRHATNQVRCRPLRRKAAAAAGAGVQGQRHPPAVRLGQRGAPRGRVAGRRGSQPTAPQQQGWRQGRAEQAGPRLPRGARRPRARRQAGLASRQWGRRGHRRRTPPSQRRTKGSQGCRLDPRGSRGLGRRRLRYGQGRGTPLAERGATYRWGCQSSCGGRAAARYCRSPGEAAHRQVGGPGFGRRHRCKGPGGMYRRRQTEGVGRPGRSRPR